MIVLRVVLIGLVVVLIASCGKKADSDSDATAAAGNIEKADKTTSAAANVEEPIMRREFEGELSQIQAGVHLQLNYDAEADAFVGVMRNATMLPVEGAQVTVKLSDGTTFGPTDPMDLEPSRPHEISISAEGSEVTAWSVQITANTNQAVGKAKTE